MKHTKKLIALFLTTLMLIGAVPTMVGADSTEGTVTYPTYAEANDGDLLYKVNFNGDEYWQPTTQAGAAAVSKVLDDGSATTTKSGAGHFGTAVNGLYLKSDGENSTKYTITFETNQYVAGTSSNKMHTLIFSCDSITNKTYGTSDSNHMGLEFYNNSTNTEFKYKRRSYGGNSGRANWIGTNETLEKHEFNDIDMVTFAIEIDCKDEVIKYYKLLGGKTWALQFQYDYSTNTSIPENRMGRGEAEPLKLLFAQYGGITEGFYWRNVEIRKGNIINTGSRDMSDVGLQFKASETNGYKDMRVVSVIDSTDYDYVGYDVEVYYGAETPATARFEMRSVYSSLTAKYGTQIITLETLGYHKDSGYMTAFTINNISCSGTITVKLTPFTVKGGVTTTKDQITLVVDANAETATKN